jgi:hypothetical protein
VVTEDVPAFTVKSILVTYDYDVKNTQSYRAVSPDRHELRQI